MQEKDDDARLNASLKAMAGKVAHDMNNILMAVSTFMTLIERQVQGGPVDSYMEQIRGSLSKANRLTDRLLLFAERASMEHQSIPPESFITNMRPRFLEVIGDKAIELEMILTPDLPPLFADPLRLQTALLQVVRNAVKSMNRGRILLEAAMSEEGDGKRFINITISDTGHGMSPEVSARAFEPFFSGWSRGKEEGLGLAIVHGIVRQSGGSVTLSSEEGIGTTVTLTLPVATEKERSRPRPVAASEEVEGHGERILIIDDDESVLASLTANLEALGFEVVRSSSGEEAIALITEQKILPDLVLADVILPGMDGRQTVEKILETHPGIPCIYMSGYSESRLGPGRILEPGIILLKKPFSMKELLTAIAAALERKPYLVR